MEVVRLAAKHAPLVQRSEGLTSGQSNPQVHPEAIGRCRISQPRLCAVPPAHCVLEPTMQSQDRNSPGQDTPQTCQHSSLEASRVAADPLDLGRASTAVQAIQLSGQLNGKPVRFMLDSGAM